MPAVEVLKAGEVSIRLRADELRVGDRLRLSLDVLHERKTGPIVLIAPMYVDEVILTFEGNGIRTLVLPNDYAVSAIVPETSLPRNLKPGKHIFGDEEIEQQSG